MTYFSNIKLPELDDTEMQEWYDSNPIPNEVVLYTGGMMFYFDDDFILQKTGMGKTLVFSENVDTYTDTSWNSGLLNCEIVGFWIDGVLQRDISGGPPSAGEFWYDSDTGSFNLNAALSGEWVMVQYVQSWQPLIV